MFWILTIHSCGAAPDLNGFPLVPAVGTRDTEGPVLSISKTRQGAANRTIPAGSQVCPGAWAPGQPNFKANPCTSQAPSPAGPGPGPGPGSRSARRSTRFHDAPFFFSEAFSDIGMERLKPELTPYPFSGLFHPGTCKNEEYQFFAVPSAATGSAVLGVGVPLLEGVDRGSSRAK